MFDNIADLIDKIRLGEDSYLELKEVRFAGQMVSAPTTTTTQRQGRFQGI